MAVTRGCLPDKGEGDLAVWDGADGMGNTFIKSHRAEESRARVSAVSMEISQAASHWLTMFETVYYCNLDLAYATAIATYR